MGIISGGAIFESVGLFVGFSGRSAYQNIPYAKAPVVFGGIPPYTFSLTAGGLPAGLSLSSSTGAITGTPTGTGASSFTITVNDSGSGIVNFPITINVNTLVSIALTPNPTSIAIGFTQQLIATGTWSDSSTFNVVLQSTWASSNNSLATVGTGGSNNGLVTAVAAGMPTITASLNSVTSPTDTITIPSGVTNPVFSTTSLPNGQINFQYPENSGNGFQLSCSGGSGGPPYTFAKASGTFQSGLSLSSSGLISGMPIASGTQALTFTCTDAGSNTSSPSASINLIVASLSSVAVTPANPTVAIGAQQLLTCTATFSDASTAPCPAGGASLISSGGCSDSTGATYTAFTCAGISQGSLTATVVAGQVLVVFVNYQGNTTETLSVTDSLGNTWNAIGTKQTGALLGAWQMFRSTITNAGSTTISANASIATGYPVVLFHLYAGINTSTVLDPNVGNPWNEAYTASTTGCSTTGITTTNANDVLVEFCTTTGAPVSFTPGSGFIQAVTDPVSKGTSSEYEIVSATQSSATVTHAASGSFGHVAAQVVALEVAVPGTAWSSSNGNVTVGSSGLVTGVAAGTSVVTATYGGQSGTSNITVPSASNVPTYVQSISTNHYPSTLNSLSATLSGSTPVGNLILVAVDWDDSPPRTFVSISDDIGNVYTQIGSEQHYLGTGAADWTRAYWAINKTAGTRTLTYSVTSDAAATFIGMTVMEYTSVGSNPISAFSWTSYLSTAGVINPTSIVTPPSQPSTIVGFVFGGGPSPLTNGAGWTSRISSGTCFQVEEQSSSSTGAITVPWIGDGSAHGFGLWDFVLTSGSNQGVTQVNVLPSPASGNVGNTVQFSAKDQNNNPLVVAWTTSNANVATINGSTGLANCVANGTATITATYQTLSGQSVLTCSTIGNTSLLTGCTVNASNLSNCSTPAGWTFVVAQGFDGGALPPSQGSLGTIGPATGTTCHTGTNCLGGLLNGDQSGATWALEQGNLGTFTSVYLSFWEWIDANATTNDEFFVANLSFSDSILEQEMVVDRYQCWGNASCAFNGTAPNVVLALNSDKTNANGGAHGVASGPNVNINAGVWHQWEIQWTPNTPAIDNQTSPPNPGAGDGSVVIYRDGSIVNNYSGININGTWTMTNAKVTAGGVYTKLIWTNTGSNPPSGTCSSSIGNGTTVNADSGLSFSSLGAICGPTVPSFYRYIDDIILLKK